MHRLSLNDELEGRDKKKINLAFGQPPACPRPNLGSARLCPALPGSASACPGLPPPSPRPAPGLPPVPPYVGALAVGQVVKHRSTWLVIWPLRQLISMELPAPVEETWVPRQLPTPTGSFIRSPVQLKHSTDFQMYFHFLCVCVCVCECVCVSSIARPVFVCSNEPCN